MIYYTILPEVFSSDDFENLYLKLSPHLPDFRRSKADSIIPAKERAVSALSFYLLCHALSIEYSGRFDSTRICDIGGSISFSYKANGKPVLLPPYEDIHFNISHCRTAVACAIAPFEIGLDIQDIRQPSAAVLKHLFNKGNEKAQPGYISYDICNLENAKGFSAFWSRYEAYTKLTGEGITRHLSDCDYLSDIFLRHEHVSISTVPVINNQKKTAAFLSAAFFRNGLVENDRFLLNSSAACFNIKPVSVDFSALCESAVL